MFLFSFDTSSASFCFSLFHLHHSLIFFFSFDRFVWWTNASEHFLCAFTPHSHCLCGRCGIICNAFETKLFSFPFIILSLFFSNELWTHFCSVWYTSKMIKETSHFTEVFCLFSSSLYAPSYHFVFIFPVFFCVFFFFASIFAQNTYIALAVFSASVALCLY